MGLFDHHMAKSPRQEAVALITGEAVKIPRKTPSLPITSMQQSEVARIIGMQTVGTMTDADVDEYSKRNIKAEFFDKGFRMLKRQAEAVCSFEVFRKAFCPIGVGEGKTGISLMIPEKAYANGVERMVLIIPPSIVNQLVNTDIPFWRQRTNITYPIHVLAQRNAKERARMTKAGRRGLYIISYGLLSTKDTMDMFHGIKPELIICDEAQELGNRRSARAKRMGKVFEEYKPILVPMSGTITNKTIMDYYSLAKTALGKSCFLPLDVTTACDWAGKIDAETTKSGVDTRHWRPGPLEPIMQWAQRERDEEVAEAASRMDNPIICGNYMVEYCCDGLSEIPVNKFAKLKKCPSCREKLSIIKVQAPEIPLGIAGFRRAFNYRMRTCPGVISSPENTVPTSLVFENLAIPDAKKISYGDSWRKLKDFANGVEKGWVTPNGDEIDHAMHAWKWLYQLYGGGFYTECVWPTAESVAKRKRMDVSEVLGIIDKAKKYHAESQFYNSELRGWLGDNHIEGLDTPLLVGQSMYQHKDTYVTRRLYEVWSGRNSLEFPERQLLQGSNTDTYGRVKNGVRVCPFKIDAMVAWAKKTLEETGKGALIWVHHIEMGLWAYEALAKAGLPALNCPSGEAHNIAITDPKNAGKMMVASIKSHGTGKNLQHFQNNYFLEWTRPASRAEQTIGRTHRTGQKADRLTMHTCLSSRFDHMLFAATLNDSLYVHQTASAQRLIFADYNPMPEVFPCEVLFERGLKPTMLSNDQRSLMREMFGRK